MCVTFSAHKYLLTNFTVIIIFVTKLLLRSPYAIVCLGFIIRYVSTTWLTYLIRNTSKKSTHLVKGNTSLCFITKHGIS